jgi:hypothetical protein
MRLNDATIENGDVLLFEGRSWFARAIKLRTRSKFSHAGIALWIQTGGTRRLFICEAMEPWGVRLHPLGRYLEECTRRGEVVHLYQLDRTVDRDKVAGYAVEQAGKRYASVWQFLVSWGRVTGFFRWLFGKKVCDTNPDRFFCSELVAAALRAGGYVPAPEADMLPAVTDPGSLALFPCLQIQGVLTP